MKKKKKLKKRYIITILSILLAIISVLLLHALDINYTDEKIVIENELKAISEFNKNYFSQNNSEKTILEKTEILRNNFANKISYKKLLNNKNDFNNFKYLPQKEIYGFQQIDNAQIGFYHNSDNCGKMYENNDYCMGIIIDVNSKALPNKFGKDQLLLKIYKDGISE